MKKTLTTLVLSIVSTCLFSQGGFNFFLLENYHPTRKTENIKGDVKTIHRYQYEAIERFGEAEKTTGYLKEKLTFDKKGNQTEKIEYNSDGTIKQKESWKYNENYQLIENKNVYQSNRKLTKKYIYNSRGNLVEKIYYNSDGNQFDKFVYAYNSNGQISESNNYRAGVKGMKNIFKYNSNGLLVSKTTYTSYGTLHSKLTYKYDSNENLTGRSYFDGVTGREEERYVMKYNDEGFETLFELYNRFNEKEGSEFKILDDENNSILRSYKNPETVGYNSYKYTYDNEGNWTKKISFEILNLTAGIKKPSGITERKIEYY